MKKSIGSVFLAFVFLTVLLSGCAPASTPVPPTSIPVPIPTNSSSSVSNNPSVSFFNEWVNVDSQSGSITRVSIQAKDGGTYINMFGSCHPTDCNFREGNPVPVVSYNYDSEASILHVEWTMSFAVLTQQLSLVSTDGQLKVTTHTHFTDNSGRLDYDSVDYFTRQ